MVLFRFEWGRKAGNYLGSGIGIVLVVLGRRILDGKPGISAARHEPCSQTPIAHERNTAALVLSLSKQHTWVPTITCSIDKNPTRDDTKSVPTLNLTKWRRRQDKIGQHSRFWDKLLGIGEETYVYACYCILVAPGLGAHRRSDQNYSSAVLRGAIVNMVGPNIVSKNG